MTTRKQTLLALAITMSLNLNGAYADDASDQIRASFKRAFNPVAEAPSMTRIESFEGDVLYPVFADALWTGGNPASERVDVAIDEEQTPSSVALTQR